MASTILLSVDRRRSDHVEYDDCSTPDTAPFAAAAIVSNDLSTAVEENRSDLGYLE